MFLALSQEKVPQSQLAPCSHRDPPGQENFPSHSLAKLISNPGDDHRIMEWFGSEWTLKLISFQPLAMGRDTFHCPRLLPALPNLAWSTSRHGAVTASLGNLNFYNFLWAVMDSCPSWGRALLPLSVVGTHWLCDFLALSPSPPRSALTSSVTTHGLRVKHYWGCQTLWKTGIPHQY